MSKLLKNIFLIEVQLLRFQISFVPAFMNSEAH